ncbi:MAG: hypothetical protein WC435_01720 [Candidatus Paceibacterota bacterium]
MKGNVVSLNVIEEEYPSSSSLREKKITFMVKGETVCVSLKQGGWVLGWCERVGEEAKNFIQDSVLGKMATREARGDACICLRESLEEKEIIEMFERAGCEIIKERKCPREREVCRILAMAK